MALQRAVKNHQQFSSLNEYLCTILWVCWTLEAAVIGYASSSHHVISSLFVRLLLWPSLALDACVNPCNSIYTAVQDKSPKKVPHTIMIQCLAMATGLLFSSLMWRVLSSGGSDIHRGFMTSRGSPFLNVGVVDGFLLELGMSFVMYLPKVVMRTGFTCNFVSAVVTCVMIFLLGHTTGAFMNPIAALSLTLVWHSTSFRLTDIIIVYWLGPFLGAAFAAGFDMWLAKRKEKLHLS